jgi:DNA-binding MarR family transcriptional regulator
MDNVFPSRFDGPANSPGFRFWHRFLAWQRGVNQQLAPLGLTQPQFSILAMVGWLLKTDGHAPQKAVIHKTGLDAMTVSHLVRRLERLGLLQRVQDKTDKRAWILTLTDHGQRVLVQAIPVVEAFDLAFFASPPDAPSI